MMRDRIYLSPPHMSGEEMKYIQEAFETNWIAPLGPNVDAFEEAIAEYVGVEHVAVLTSGTAALHLALIILGVQPGDEVIASTFTFSATINPIIYQGATPILIDSESETWNMDPDLLERAIKDRLKKGKVPKAIIPVHLYGMPANMKKIMSVAEKYNIPVIEDAAEALGSRFMGKPLGSFGKMAVLSFNGNKILNTSGGGALLSNDKEVISRAKFLSTQARDKAPYYQHSHVGYNYRMSNILAGIGRGQMEVIADRVLARRNNFKYYRENLKQYEALKFLAEPDECYFSNHWLTTITIDTSVNGINCDLVITELEKKNIETRYLWKPMHQQPIFSDYPVYKNGVSDELFKKGLCLPSGSQMSDKDLNSVIICLKELLES